MKLKFKLLLGAVLLLAAGIYYYVTIPAFNIHSNGFWLFIVSLVVILGGLLSIRKLREGYAVKDIKILKAALILAGTLIVIYVVGSVLSSPIINSRKYHDLMKVEDGTFTEDIEEVDYNEIPLLDKRGDRFILIRHIRDLVRSNTEQDAILAEIRGIPSEHLLHIPVIVQEIDRPFQ